MGHDAIKLELIEWLVSLDDEETIEFLRVVKDSKDEEKDWWDNISQEEREGIKRGLKDRSEGRVVPHLDEVGNF